MCPGAIHIEGHGQLALTNSGHASDVEESADAWLPSDREVIMPMHGRAYFGKACQEGYYINTDYSALDLTGKTLRFTVDISGARCGCNAAFYLTSLAQNSDPSTCGDYYCDANKVCGVRCTEIDIMEANRHAWLTTLHGSEDGMGKGDGLGGGKVDALGKFVENGPRSFTKEQYGPGGGCVDTSMSFQVEASFPVVNAVLQSVEVRLSQQGKPCDLTLRVGDYSYMEELTQALWNGMTPMISYWKSKDLQWLDGAGVDGQGFCTDETQSCSDSIRLSDFSVTPMQPGPSRDRVYCADVGENCRTASCCRTPGRQCYERDGLWAECLDTCLATAMSGWSCHPLGSRTPFDGATLPQQNVSSIPSPLHILLFMLMLTMLAIMGMWMYRKVIEDDDEDTRSEAFFWSPSKTEPEGGLWAGWQFDFAGPEEPASNGIVYSVAYWFADIFSCSSTRGQAPPRRTARNSWLPRS